MPAEFCGVPRAGRCGPDIGGCRGGRLPGRVAGAVAGAVAGVPPAWAGTKVLHAAANRFRRGPAATECGIVRRRDPGANLRQTPKNYFADVTLQLHREPTSFISQPY